MMPLRKLIPQEELPKLYMVEQAAEFLGIHKNTIYKYLREGKLKGKKIGKRYFIPEKALLEFIDI